MEVIIAFLANPIVVNLFANYVLPLAGIVLVPWLSLKLKRVLEQLEGKIKTDKNAKILDRINAMIIKIVTSTAQTTVSSLKKTGGWTPDIARQIKNDTLLEIRDALKNEGLIADAYKLMGVDGFGPAIGHAIEEAVFNSKGPAVPTTTSADGTKHNDV